jgi:magnesium transporter
MKASRSPTSAITRPTTWSTSGWTCATPTATISPCRSRSSACTLAVEAALHPSQRPKLDRYRSHLFLTVYGARLDPASGELATSELAAFITRQALITIRKDDGHLLYGLLDYVVDGQSEAVQSLDDSMEELEAQLFDDVPHRLQVQRRSFQRRKSLVLLRRVVIPMREVVGELMRHDLNWWG